MKIGMLFPDYASQYVGMGKELYDASRIIQEYYEEASNCLNTNFVKLCFASSEAELSKIAHAYVATYLVSSSTAAFLKQEGIQPHVVAGYGIGQFSALSTDHGLSLPDGLYLLSKFAHFYQELLSTHDLAKISIQAMKVSKVQKLCATITDDDAQLSVAAINAATHCVVSGHRDYVNSLISLLEKEDAKVKELSPAGGLYNPMMEPIVQQLSLYTQKVDFKDAETSFITTVDAKSFLRGDLIKNRVLKQIQAPILWHKTLAYFKDCDLIIHCGPGKQLEMLTHEVLPQATSISINTLADVEHLKALMQEKNTVKVSHELS